LASNFSRTRSPGATFFGATSPRPGPLGAFLGTGSLFPGAGFDAGSSFRSSIATPWSQETRPLQPPRSKKGEKCADDFGNDSLSDPGLEIAGPDAYFGLPRSFRYRGRPWAGCSAANGSRGGSARGRCCGSWTCGTRCCRSTRAAGTSAGAVPAASRCICPAFPVWRG
jgi:hypothetical protein